jgi:hypothetical protein
MSYPPGFDHAGGGGVAAWYQGEFTSIWGDSGLLGGMMSQCAASQAPKLAWGNWSRASQNMLPTVHVPK